MTNSAITHSVARRQLAQFMWNERVRMNSIIKSLRESPNTDDYDPEIISAWISNVRNDFKRSFYGARCMADRWAFQVEADRGDWDEAH